MITKIGRGDAHLAGWADNQGERPPTSRLSSPGALD